MFPHATVRRATLPIQIKRDIHIYIVAYIARINITVENK